MLGWRPEAGCGWIGGVSEILKAMVLAARPKTLPAAVVPVWAGGVLAWRMSGVLDAGLLAATLAGAIAIQIATNFFNDAIDAKKGADTRRRLGPVRVTASGLMSPAAVYGAAAFCLAVAVGCGVVLYQARGWPIVAIGVPSLFLAYGYTGGPVPLAYRGLGELFVVMFFGLVAVAGTVFIQTGTWPAAALLLGWQVGLLSAVLISINNLRDREEDAGTGKRTLAVRLGRKAALGIIGLEIALPVVSAAGWAACGYGGLALAAIPVVLIGPLVLARLAKLPPGPAYNRLLALSGVQLLLFAVVFHVAAVIGC
ncbi:MAG: 1,4-dihydroxy-2-naphthoate octaprenyltransferase [Verrucomicrobia bacterium]|nr:1,4-dihydroxy-2-naphthoate octaprenyltransferase [Verrucomicrobiota bacterium]